MNRLADTEKALNEARQERYKALIEALRTEVLKEYPNATHVTVEWTDYIAVEITLDAGSGVRQAAIVEDWEAAWWDHATELAYLDGIYEEACSVATRTYQVAVLDETYGLSDPLVTCDGCNAVSESGWGDTPLCLGCEAPERICPDHDRTFDGESCPLSHP